MTKDDEFDLWFEDESFSEELHRLSEKFVQSLPKPRPRTDEEVIAFWDELDRETEELGQRHKEWQEAIPKWGISLKAVGLDDPESDHPLSIAFWNGDGPEEWTRKEARTEHRIWERVQKAEAEKRRAKQIGGYARMGLDVETAELLRQMDDEEDAEFYAKLDEEEKLAQPYVIGARKVVQSWRDRGAKLMGVPIDVDKINRNSKVVRWLRSKTEGKAIKHVNETVTRMVNKKGWRRDFEEFRAFKK